MKLSRYSSFFFGYVIKSELSCDPTLYSNSKPKMIDVVVPSLHFTAAEGQRNQCLLLLLPSNYQNIYHNLSRVV